MKLLRIFPLLFLAISLAAQTRSPASNPGVDNLRSTPAKVEGEVVNSTNGTPVSTVTLTLRSVNSVQNYVVSSDSKGKFIFDDVEPGRYALSAEKRGFVREYYGPQGATSNGTPLTVSEGQVIKGLVFKLAPQGVISGKVTDESGEPMEKVSVVVMRRGYWQGKPTLLSSGGGLSNDLGEFRIASLRPGSYYLMVHRGSIMSDGTRFAHADVPSTALPEKPEESYVDTYYPSSIDAEGAAELHVSAGSEISGADITFRKARVFRVRGQVIDGATGQPATEARVALKPPKNGNMLSMSSLGGPTLSDGKFEVTGLIPGPYVLTAAATRNSQTVYARQPVYVYDRNITGMVIRTPEAINVAGRLRVTGQDIQNPDQQAFRMESLRILLVPAEEFGVGDLPKTTAQANGSFVLHNVVPDKFHVDVLGRPPGWYVKAILLGGRECADGIADLTGGGALDIILAKGGAEVAGTVADADDKPASGATVNLVPEDAGKQGRTDLFRITTSDQNGQFLLQDVVPGSYKIFAWQEVETAAIQDPQFRSLFERKAVSLTLSESERETVQLRAISVGEVAEATGNHP